MMSVAFLSICRSLRSVSVLQLAHSEAEEFHEICFSLAFPIASVGYEKVTI